MKVTDICSDKGITMATFYSWKRKYGGMDTQQVKELKSLQEENLQSQTDVRLPLLIPFKPFHINC